jgi:hypothetical protein
VGEKEKQKENEKKMRKGKRNGRVQRCNGFSSFSTGSVEALVIKPPSVPGKKCPVQMLIPISTR